MNVRWWKNVTKHIVKSTFSRKSAKRYTLLKLFFGYLRPLSTPKNPWPLWNYGELPNSDPSKKKIRRTMSLTKIRRTMPGALVTNGRYDPPVRPLYPHARLTPVLTLVWTSQTPSSRPNHTNNLLDGLKPTSPDEFLRVPGSFHSFR